MGNEMYTIKPINTHQNKAFDTTQLAISIKYKKPNNKNQ